MNTSIFIFAVLLMVQSWPYRHLVAIRYLGLFLLSFCFCSFFTMNVYTSSLLEDKIFSSRFRYIGFAILAPAGLLFFSSILNRWKWLHKPWVTGLLFAPSIGTFLITIGVFDPNLHVRNFAPFEYLGVSVLTFDAGPWFWVHYRWNNVINLMAIVLLVQAMLQDKERRGKIFFLSLGVFVGSIVDAYCVAVNSPFRWLMLSAGTFAITEISIWYVSKKYDLLGILSVEKNERKKLRESMEFQKKMLTLLTHDLSGNIHQQAQLAQFLRRKLQDNHHEILNTWSESAQASSDLIGNIMRWIKTQADEFKPQIVPVEIHSLLQKNIENVSTAFADRKVEIKTEIPTSPYFAKCDPEMMASIVRNLVSNAIKASEDGQKVLVKIKQDGSRMRMTVQDQGRGMSPEQIQGLWTNHNLKSAGTGYGFGLILVHHFVELHQGSLQVESTPAQGTEIYFSIPL